ncbi:unnamed protein product [Microthlaspi erraticum]|uniref:Uncharacterized protein n=1 Tax=Microthlaspi erraticum TaxID=1685480 RepID=A0A6D2HIR9_9BRAS|nr:unnamed protein product [Microthlaspi erraticum]
MDFIKTSSLRALIELTFQRNWNGLIWMSRKGVITKRVKTVQTALSRTAPNRAVRLAEERMFRARPNHIRPTEVSAKVQTDRPITHTTRETLSRGRPSQRSRHPRTTKAREPGNKPRGRATRSAYHGRCIRPSRERTSHVRPRISSAKSQSARPRRPTANPSDPDRSDSATTRLSGRSSRTTVPTPRCMTRRSNKDNLVEHPEIDKLEKQLRKQKAQEMADEAARAHAAEVARAQEEGRDPPPPPPNPLLEM